MEASRQQLFPGIAVAPPSDRAREPGCVMIKRIARNATVALVLANLAGAVVTFVLGAWVVPAPQGLNTDANLRNNLIGFGATLLVGLVVGTWLSIRASRDAQRWLREERAPTPEERDATLRFPMRQTLVEAVLWAACVIEFFLINLITSDVLAIEAGIEILIGGLLTCSLTYLLVERLNRDATARALESGVPERLSGPAIGCRLLLTWAASSALPLLGIGLMGVAALSDDPPSLERVGIAVIVLAAVGAIVGAATMSISARSIAEPLRALRGALARVEEGELDVRVQIDDAGEIGVLQGGFNRMAHGLAERERLRDLFGRHVGEEVARQAIESEEVELGGEAREAAVLFVDVIGSTTLASTHDPAAVVERLNAFFAIVVDTVSLHGGWVNKFEGDAALCVFGAPTAHPDPAGSALASARALRFRLADLAGVDAAIGVSAGVVVAGNVGAAERFEYTVIGDPVNEAARLTELAKTCEGRLLASDAAIERAGAVERRRWQTDREVALRGRARATRIAVPS
ncbi:MAG: adenylate cyclase [Thermoleophilaceae bacterium]|jgi:adenylate cyclase|nr:adenylate cyclase [Thermoleophilaceae bacterium]